MSPHFSRVSTRRRPRPAAQGISLIEVLAVMSANAVLMGAAVVMLVTIGRADRGFDKRLNQQRAVAQFTEQLRTDLHAARQATWDEPQATLRLTATDGKVLTYVAESERWVRHESVPGDPSEGKLTGAYPIPAGLQTKFEPAEAASGQRVRIEWSLLDGGPALIAEMIAVVGQDERLLHE